MNELSPWVGFILAGIAGVFGYGRLSQKVEQQAKEITEIKGGHKEDLNKLFKKIDELVGMVQEFKIEIEKYMSSDKEQKSSFKETITRIEKEIQSIKTDA
jgi:uncharacterized coiled-coil DUF342 family protein